MSKNVTIMRNPFAPETAERIEGVESVRQTIMDAFDVWPSGARIYDGAIARVRDVTPASAAEVEALEDLSTDEVIVVVYPEGIIEILLVVIAVVATAAAIFLIPAIPELRNQQAQSGNNQLTDRQNRPRPNARIPDIYGRVRSVPDLIAAPYTIFQAHQEIEVAYMCVGRGEFEIHDIRDDSTDLASIDGASAEVYGPGTSPNSGTPFYTVGTAINRPVLTAKRITSVNGQVLEGVASVAGPWVGPFTVSLSGQRFIQCNIVALQGMFKDDGEDQTATNVTVEIEVQPVDDSGIAIGSPITSSGTIFGSATTRDLRAITITVDLGAPTRNVAVRMRRTTPLNTTFNGTVVDEVKWRDCYGMAEVLATDFGDVTTVQVQTYATAGALAVKNRKLNMLVTRKLPVREGLYGFGTTLAPTRSAAAALCSMALDAQIGRLTGGTLVSDGGVGQVDVEQIFDEVAAAVAYFGIEAAGEFSFTFDDDRLSFQEMAQMVAQAAFCQVYRRGSILRLSLERPQDDSLLLFNHANKLPGTERRTYSFGARDGHDGVALTYVNPLTDVETKLYVPQGDDTAVNPSKVVAYGVRNFEQAYLHAWRHWNRIRYHFLTEICDALQEADLLVRFDRVLSADTTRANLMTGEIMAQDGLVLTLSQPAVLDPLKTYQCFLQLSTGVVEAIAVTQGGNEYEVDLAAPPTAPLVVSDNAVYRTGYIIVEDGAETAAPTPMLVIEKEPREGFEIGLRLINYDERYYGNDLDYFVEAGPPGPDPDDPIVVGPGTPDPGVSVSISPPSTSTFSNAPSHSILAVALATGGVPTSYFWGVLSGNGQITSQSGEIADLLVWDLQGGDGSTAIFYCDMLIAGVTYRAFCTMTHVYEGNVGFPPNIFDPNYNIP